MSAETLGEFRYRYVLICRSLNLGILAEDHEVTLPRRERQRDGRTAVFHTPIRQIANQSGDRIPQLRLLASNAEHNIGGRRRGGLSVCGNTRMNRGRRMPGSCNG